MTPTPAPFIAIAVQPPMTPAALPAEAVDRLDRALQDTRYMQGAIVASLTALAMLIAGLLLWRLAMDRRVRADDVVQTLGAILIIGSGLYMVTAQYADSVIAPVVGLLGAIADYLFGRGATGANGEGSKPEEPKP